MVRKKSKRKLPKFLFSDLKKNKQTLLKNSKLLLIFSIILVMGLVFVLGDVNFTPIYPTTNITTNESFVNISINFSTNGQTPNSVNYTYNNVSIDIMDGLIGAWNLNNFSDLGERNNYTFDYSGNGNNGTVINTTNVTFDPNCILNGCFNFGGHSTGYINVSDTDLLKVEELTLSVWFKANTPPDERRIIGKGWKYGVTLRSDGRIGVILGLSDGQYFSYYTDGTANSVYGDNTWHHVVITYNLSKVSYYIDGQFKVSHSDSGYIGNDTSSFAIGRNTAGGASQYFIGEIDDPKVYDRAVSKEEAYYLYASSLTKYNQTDWNFNINQSINQSSYLINKTNPIRNITYSLCVNDSNMNCQTNLLTQIIKNKYLNANFTEEIGSIRKDIYGANTHGNYLSGDEATYGVKLDTDNNGTVDTYANITEYRNYFNDANLGMSRGDGRIYDIYTVIPNKGAEFWYNISQTGAKGSFLNNAPLGHTLITDGGGGIPHSSRSTDAHSGTYSANVTNFNSTGGSVYDSMGLDADIGLGVYNISVWIKSNNSITISIQRLDTFATMCSQTSISSGEWEHLSCSFNYSTYLSNGYRFLMSAGANESFLWDDLSTTRDGVEFDFYVKSPLTLLEEYTHIQYLNSLGKEYLVIVDQVPNGLQNYSNLCNATGLIQTCMPYNMSIWNSILDYHFRNITNNGEWSETVLTEIKNEPELSSFFMSGIVTGDVYSRLPYYFELYNNSYDSIKLVNSSIKVCGMALASLDTQQRKWGFVYFMGNFSNKIDCLTWHDYDAVYTTGAYWIFDNATSLGLNVSHYIISETNVRDAFIKNTTSREKEYENKFLRYYVDGIIKYPSNMSYNIYQFAEEYSFINNFANYPEKNKWEMVSGRQLDNTTSINYETIKKLSGICQPEGVSYKSSLDNCIEIASCKKGTQYGLVLLNNCTYSYNLSNLNLSGSYPYNNIINLETLEVYTKDPTTGLIDLGSDAIMDSYQEGGQNNILYLTSGDEGTLVNLFKFNEATGTRVYDLLQNVTYGTISGATWVTDGIFKTLTSAIDYTINLETGLLTLDTDYLYEYLFIDYNYNKIFGFHVSILNVIAGFLMIVVLGVAIIYVVKYFKNIKELE